LALTTSAERYGERLLELDVSAFLAALWRRRVRTLALVIVAAAASGAWTALREKEYSAASMIAVAAEENRPQPAIGMYAQLAQDTSAAAEVIRAAGLDHGARTVSPEALLADHLVVSQGRDLPTLTIEARMWTPELAADVANRIADKVVERASKIAAPTVTVLRAESDAAKTRLKAAADALASASGEYKANDGIVRLPRQSGTTELFDAATGGAWQAPRDGTKYSAFVDAVGEYEVAMRVYMQAASAYQRELLFAETRPKGIQVVDRAAAPAQPVQTRPARSAVIGGFIGLLVAAAWAALELAITSPRERTRYA
jgi:capsular polysaccharide biosynthesis protein